MTSSPSSPIPEPLDLLDIRKTQRRVCALLRLPEPRGGLKITVRRKHPENFCYICSRLDPDGKYPANPHRYLFEYGYFNRCPHQPRAPHPTMVDFNSGMLSDDDHLFDTEILNQDSTNTKKHGRSRFKISKTFEKENENAGESLIPLVSDNTFVSTQVGNRQKGNKNALELPPLSQERKDLVAADLDPEESLQLEQGGRRQRIPRPGHSKRGKINRSQSETDDEKDSSRSLDVHVPGEFDSFDDEDADSKAANLRYRHRTKSGKYNMPGNRDDLYADGETFPGGKRNRRNKHSGYSPSGGVSFSRESTLTTPSPTSDFMMSVIKSSAWCECSDVDINKLRCSECFGIGKHEKWCVSKFSVCPKCGKQVRIRHEHSPKKIVSDGGSFSQEDVSRASAGKDGNNNNISKTDKEICSPNGKERKLKVKFSDCLDESESVDYNSGDEQTAEGKPKKRDNSGSKTTTSLPHINPNIHKRAYLLALSDAAVKRFRKDPDMFRKRGTGLYFSYFPLYKHKNYKLPGNTKLGLRPNDSLEKVKVKKGLKHILGDVNIADYYPGGKKYIPEAEEYLHDPRWRQL